MKKLSVTEKLLIMQQSEKKNAENVRRHNDKSRAA